MFNPCIVIPYYRHERAIGTLLERLRPHGLPCWIVDDGSGGEAAEVVRTLVALEPHWLRLLVLPHNSGKGVAVMSGCEAAAAAGFSHAVQIDADCQHDAADLPRLVEQAREHPAAVVTGIPRYDASVPKVRFYGRYITHVLVWLHTLSFEIVDSMCGFRVYPLASALALWRRGVIGKRMDFDTSILVRLHWAGIQVISLPTPVTYPADGVSHFHYFSDNLRMIRMHVLLLLGMLLRLPLWMGRSLLGRAARRGTA